VLKSLGPNNRNVNLITRLKQFTTISGVAKITQLMFHTKGRFRRGARGAEAPPLQVYSTPVQSFAGTAGK